MYRLFDGPTWLYLRYAIFRMLKRNTVLPTNRKDFPMFPKNVLRYASFDSIDNEWKISAIWAWTHFKICSIVLQTLLTNWFHSTLYLSNYSNCFASCSSATRIFSSLISTVGTDTSPSLESPCSLDQGWSSSGFFFSFLIVSRSYSVRSRALCLASLERCRKSRFRNLEVSPCCCDGLSPVGTTARCLNHFTYFRCIA